MELDKQYSVEVRALAFDLLHEEFTRRDSLATVSLLNRALEKADARIAFVRNGGAL